MARPVQIGVVGTGFTSRGLTIALDSHQDLSLSAALTRRDIRSLQDFPYKDKLTNSLPELIEKSDLNLAAMLLPRERGYWSQQVRSVRDFVTTHCPETTARGPLRSLGKVVTGIHDMAAMLYRKAVPGPSFNPTLEKGGWSERPDVKGAYATFELVSLVEQAPDPSNRVMLGLDRDQLGARKLELHWSWSKSDNRQIVRARERIGQELERAGLGKFELRDVAPRNPDSAHHMGATRMHRDPRQGVVDADCKVHGIANLFVAGSSVFPTGGFANPTLTIVALAARLADHLKQVCRGFA